MLRLFSVTAIVLAAQSVYAAKPVDLSHHAIPLTSSFASPLTLKTLGSEKDPVKITGSNTDKNQVMHVRVQQMYAGIPVWGADGVIHLPVSKNRATLAVNTKNLVEAANKDSSIPKNGKFYAGLQQEINPADINKFNTETAKKSALDHYKQLYLKSDATKLVSDEEVSLFVYNDDKQIARVVYLVTFFASSPNKMPERPTAIVDAQTYAVLKQWNDIKTLHYPHQDITSGKKVSATGRGGNPILGDIAYDGKDKPLLSISRNETTQRCFLGNEDVEVHKASSLLTRELANAKLLISFSCPKAVGSDVYATPNAGYFEKANEANSPVNDALQYGVKIKKMYADWYQTKVLKNKDDKRNPNSAMQLVMNVLYIDADYDNAFWEPRTQTMNFGLGSHQWYPLVSLGIAAHEISHGFTQQNSNLIYADQSGAMNEAFSDMAAAAISYYESGEQQADWLLGKEIYKANVGKPKSEWVALRYFATPEKDKRSIGHINQYEKLVKVCESSAKKEYPMDRNEAERAKQDCIVHLASGVYNKMFYQLATTSGWNAKSAFAVMVHANQNYWTSDTDFQGGACLILNAAKDVMNTDKVQLKKDIGAAFAAVGISVEGC